MTYEEKLEIVVQAIKEAKQFSRKDCLSKLYFGLGNGLSRVGLDMAYDILLQLQDDEKIIKVPQNKSSLGTFDQTADIKSGSKNYFRIDILDTFDDWYTNFKLKQKSKIENLSETNFNNVYHVLTLLEDHLQLSQSGKFSFSFVNSVHEIEGYDSEDVDDLINGYTQTLEYLKKIGIVKDYSHGAMSLDAEVTLDIPNYLEAMETANKVRQVRLQSGQPQAEPPEEKMQVSYDPQKGLLYVGNKKVKLNKESFRAKILELLLKDDKSKTKEWSWDEVIEEIEDTKDADLTKENKDKFYPACDGLQKHIALKIGINDLLIFNKSTVQINPKYF